MAPKAKADTAEPFVDDLTLLKPWPKDDPNKCDPLNPMTHTWEALTDWMAFGGKAGEFRAIQCADCEMGPITDTRNPDPDNPAPVYDPMAPPLTAAQQEELENGPTDS